LSRALLILATPDVRARARGWIDKAPPGTRVEFKAPKRTLPQNDRMWAMLTDLSRQQTWHGMHLSPDDWKVLFMDGLNRELRAVPSLDGRGFVNLGRSSSELSVHEMGDLMTLIEMFGAERGVVFGDAATLAKAGEAA
jgi:hypothetical protein